MRLCLGVDPSFLLSLVVFGIQWASLIWKPLILKVAVTVSFSEMIQKIIVTMVSGLSF